MTAFPIVDSSPQAKAASAKGASKSAYPFDDLPVGKSFTVPLSECNWKSLRTIVYKRNASERKAEANSVRNERAKVFTFVLHEELTPPVAEVARIA